MLEALRGLTNLVKCKRLHIDCPIFKLHYIFTVAILLAFGIIISSKQYAGEPISCESHGISPPDLINSFCFIHSTFIVQKWGQSPSWHGHEPNKTNHKYQTYYQWVCFVIFIQAILFYIPHWIWKSWESGKIRLLVSDLNDDMSLDSNKRKGQVNLVVNYLIECYGQNDWYAFKYFTCETLAFLNVILQVLLLDVFFDGEFLTLGIDVFAFLNQDPEFRNDPISRVFPKLTKCTFNKYGPSGQLQSFDSLCLLTINVINEKIFIFMWFWLFILSFITGLMLIFRIFLIGCPFIRRCVFRKSFQQNQVYGMNFILKKMKIGDWLLLDLLGQNLDAVIFKEILESFASKYKCMNRIQSTTSIKEPFFVQENNNDQTN